MQLKSINLSQAIQHTLPSWYDLAHHYLADQKNVNTYLGSFDDDLINDSYKADHSGKHLIVTELTPTLEMKLAYANVDHMAFMSANHMHVFMSNYQSVQYPIYRAYSYERYIPKLNFNIHASNNTEQLFIAFPDDPKHFQLFGRLMKRLTSLLNSSSDNTINITEANICVDRITVLVYTSEQRFSLQHSFHQSINIVEYEDAKTTPITLSKYWYFDRFPAMPYHAQLQTRVPSVCLSSLENLAEADKDTDFLSQDSAIELIRYSPEISEFTPF